MLKKSLFILLGCALLTGCSSVKKVEKEVLSFVKEVNAENLKKCLKEYGKDQCRQDISVTYGKKDDILAIRVTMSDESELDFDYNDIDLYNIARESGVKSDIIVYSDEIGEDENGNVEYDAVYWFSLNGSEDVDENTIPSLLRKAGIDTSIYWGE